MFSNRKDFPYMDINEHKIQFQELTNKIEKLIMMLNPETKFAGVSIDKHCNDIIVFTDIWTVRVICNNPSYALEVIIDWTTGRAQIQETAYPYLRIMRRMGNIV